ncbi:MAG: hypothetical protein IIT98_04605 [Kiritimatiellae bacterium]|nr:hypothetical protein [Kiritimatiellia bacterium]
MRRRTELKMADRAFDMSEFMRKDGPAEAPSAAETAEESAAAPEATDGGDGGENLELDVQKAVVEELAADKVRLERRLEERAARLRSAADSYMALMERCAWLESRLAAAEKNRDAGARADALRRENEKKNGEIARKDAEIARLLSREIDMQERNPNALALLDRDAELPDRFPGESRDHAIEAIREAAAKAEKEGFVRKAQVLEGVLVSNEPNGTLAARRSELAAVLAKNNNLVTGEVIEYLKSRGLSHAREGGFLSAAEILRFYY